MRYDDAKIIEKGLPLPHRKIKIFSPIKFILTLRVNNISTKTIRKPSMGNFVVSARKYRPMRFDEVVGQEHVGQTLKNAFKNDHLAHAFLFCGPRGVGKTTCARILAKVLNCENSAATYEPCGTCSSCQTFNENASFNILELDAASNNSVEHIRTLVEQVRFQPQQGKYKIFIIDEVHMLSASAFNAFLKTLEEPPPYAIFILATTEKHKIIPTILSRCQIFDFKRIQIPKMVEHLQRICSEENIEAEKDALHIIAQKADGALRDALSIFDRIVSFSGNKIVYDDVITNLNILDYDYYFKFTNALLMQDLPQVMNIFDGILRNGFEGDIFLNGLGEHFRNLLVCKDEATLKLLEVSEGLKGRYREQANRAQTAFLLTALNIVNDCDINYKMARAKRLHVEMALIKMTYINHAVHLAQNPTAAAEKKTPDQSISIPAATVNASPVTASSATANANPIKNTAPELNINKKTENTDNQNITKEKPASTKLSLSALEAEVTAEDSNATPLEKIELTQEKVDELWKKSVEKITSDSTRSLLKIAELSIKNDKIYIVVGSKLAVGAYHEESSIQEEFRAYFNRPDLEMKVEVDPSKAISKNIEKRPKPMTEKEKYDKMKEVNPLIAEMRQRFDLKLERE